MRIRNMQGVGAHLEEIPYKYRPKYKGRSKTCLYNIKVCQHPDSKYYEKQCIGKKYCEIYKYMNSQQELIKIDQDNYRKSNTVQKNSIIKIRNIKTNVVKTMCVGNTRSKFYCRYINDYVAYDGELYEIIEIRLK